MAIEDIVVNYNKQNLPNLPMMTNVCVCEHTGKLYLALTVLVTIGKIQNDGFIIYGNNDNIIF